MFAVSLQAKLSKVCLYHHNKQLVDNNKGKTSYGAIPCHHTYILYSPAISGRMAIDNTYYWEAQMTKRKGTPLSPEPQLLIEQFKGALTAEIEGTKKNPSAI